MTRKIAPARNSSTISTVRAVTPVKPSSSPRVCVWSSGITSQVTSEDTGPPTVAMAPTSQTRAIGKVTVMITKWTSTQEMLSQDCGSRSGVSIRENQPACGSGRRGAGVGASSSSSPRSIPRSR
ncbi:MAG: hypothetical protein LKI24_16205 [Acidipropionibacterium sp.]|nr:hypothetical protein [Acidipropionibacterium sp.]